MDRKFCELIYEDMKPALGVTEPTAIALAAAHAGALTEEEVLELTVYVSSGIYKNAYTCGIPGTKEVGNEFSAALGVLFGNAELGLLVLRDIDEEAVEKARKMISEGKVHVILDGISSSIFIRAVVRTAHDVCISEIRETHTGLSLLQKNDEVLFKKEVKTSQTDSAPELAGIRECAVSDIFRYAMEAPGEELDFLEAAYEMNLALAETGASWDRCILTGELIRQNGGFYSGDARRSAKTLAAAAAEARVLGIDQPAMSVTGSGTHGIICTLPIYAYCKVRNIPRLMRLRATALCILLCMYVKEYSGRLSAFCGCGIAGGIGLSAALALLMGGGPEEMEAAVMNMSASITGMICTGGNHCCCLKVMGAIDSAFNAAELSLGSAGVKAPHGILDASVEKTLQNVGRIADPGMTGTERTIVEIMSGQERPGTF